jgi:hypothetical protein
MGFTEIRSVGGALLLGNQAKDNERINYLSEYLMILLEVLSLHELPQ